MLTAFIIENFEKVLHCFNWKFAIDELRIVIFNFLVKLQVVLSVLTFNLLLLKISKNGSSALNKHKLNIQVTN